MSRYFERDDRELQEKPESSGDADSLSRGGSDKREREVPAAPQAVNFEENEREIVRFQGREFRIRPSERETLRTLRSFRVVQREDLVRGVYGGDESLGQADLRSLRKQGLVREITFLGPDDGAMRITTLSSTGYDFTCSQSGLFGAHHPRASLKLSDVHHDAFVYKAFLEERESIRAEGGAVTGVVLDSELKREHFSRTNKPGRTYREAQADSAEELRLPVVEGRVLFPDLRVEYEDDRGERARVDLEVATENYRGKHLAMKAGAGFRIYSVSRGGGLVVQSGPPLRGNVWPM